MFKDYYKILEINNKASADEIKSAYRSMSKKWHPDKNPNTDVTYIMQNINEAYAILKDPDKRNKYDIEYNIFIQQEVNNQTSKKYEYEYTVKDESLNNDINEAREYAHNLVNEFLNSLKETTKIAGKGAWTEMKPYLIVLIFFIFISIGVSMCINNKSDSDYDTYKNDYYNDLNQAESQNADINLSSHYKMNIAKNLPSFNIPDDWTQYNISNNSFQISVPSTVELRHEYDKYSKFLNYLQVEYNSDIIIFQQNGLSKAIKNKIDNHYCRIMIQHFSGNNGDFLKSDETSEINTEMEAFINDLVNAELGPLKAIGKPTFEWITFNNIYALEIKYRREGNKDNTTSCTIYIIQNYKEAVKMIISYREQEKDLWLPDLDNVIKTFRWL